jgi:hypothetical protein
MAAFVKWKRQRWKTWHCWGYYRGRDGDRFTKSAALVRSVRTEAGPRHKHICYLGSVCEGREGLIWGSDRFWETAGRNLDKAGITGADRERIEAAVEAVVPKPPPPPPPPDEATRREWEERNRQWKAAHGIS